MFILTFEVIVRNLKCHEIFKNLLPVIHKGQAVSFAYLHKNKISASNSPLNLKKYVEVN